MSKQNPIPEELERKIDQFIRNRMTPEEIDDLWVELLQEEEYIEYLQTSANLKEIVRRRTKSKSRPVVGRIHGVSSWKRTVAAAAAILIMVAGSIALYYSTGELQSVEPIASIELDYYRSGDSQVVETETEAVIREAIILVNDGHYDEAIRVLDEQIEVTEDPDLCASLQINAGSIMYNTGHYRDALERFQHVVSNDEGDALIRERALWFLGNTHFQLNEMDEARTAFRMAYELNGAYSRIAQSYLRALTPS
ncbi:MAG: tetratricopeptide repeat protein [Balneolaceae bacterium]